MPLCIRIWVLIFFLFPTIVTIEWHLSNSKFTSFHFNLFYVNVLKWHKAVGCLVHPTLQPIKCLLSCEWLTDHFAFVPYRVLKEREVADPINWRNHQIPVTWPCSIWFTSTPRPTLWGKLLSISSQDLRYQFSFLSVTFFFGI